MNELVLIETTAVVASDSPSQAIIANLPTLEEKEAAEVIAVDNSDEFVVVESTSFHAVIEYDYLYIPDCDSGSGIDNPPFDNKLYVRKNGAWVVLDESTMPTVLDAYLYEQVHTLNEFKQTGLGFGLDPKDAFVTINYLIAKGLLKLNEDGTDYVPVGPIYMGIPPTPTVLYAKGTIDAIHLSWPNPKIVYINHSYTRVFRSVSINFDEAIEIAANVEGSSYIDTATVRDVDYYYWIQFFSVEGISGERSINPAVARMSNNAQTILDLLEEEIRASQLHQSLLEPIQLITAPGGIMEQLVNNSLAITNEIDNRVAAIQAEALARSQALLQEALDRGTDIASVTNIINNVNQNLAEQILLITSTSNATFDSAKTWQFDIDTENWTSPGSLMFAEQGWLMPPQGEDKIIQNDLMDIDGSLNSHVRIRIRKVGNPVWGGYIQYKTALDTEFTAGHQVSIPNPAFIGSETTISIDMRVSQDWEISIIRGLLVSLFSSTGPSDYFAIDWIAVGRLGPGLSSAAILEERQAWTAALSAEALARTTLAAQLRGNYTGNNPAELTTGLLYETRRVLVNQDEALAQQIAALSAGTQNQFDYKDIWYFDSDAEGWTSSTAPILTNIGWIRPGNNAGESYILRTGLNVAGATYTQVRARIRKTGTPVWRGVVKFITAADVTWDLTKSVTITEPTYDSANIGLITANFNLPTWINQTIVGIRMELIGASGPVNYIEYDWIAIGRPSPGASYADLVSERIARTAADEALASQVEWLEASVEGKASQAAVNSLTTTVNSQGGQLTIQGNRILAMESQLSPSVLNLNPSFDTWPVSSTIPNSYIAWDNTGLSRHTGSYNYTGRNSIQFTTNNTNNSGIRFEVPFINNPEYVDVELTFTLVSGGLSGAGLLVDWRNTASASFRSSPMILKDLYVASLVVGRKIIAKFRFKRPDVFTGTFSGLNCFLLANFNSNGLGALEVKTIVFDRVALIISDASAKSIELAETRILATEQGLSIQASQLNQVQSDLNGKASSTALNAIQTQVNTQGGQISAQATQINQIVATAPGGDNLLQNPDFISGTVGWVLISAGGDPTVFEVNLSGDPYKAVSVNNIGVTRGSGSTAFLSIDHQDYIPVESNKRYCFSGKFASQRCNLRLDVSWYDVTGNFVGGVSSTLFTGVGGNNLDNWNKFAYFVTAPSTVKQAKVALRVLPTGNYPYAWMCQPMFNEVSATTTAFPMYQTSGKGAYAAVQEEAIVRAGQTGPLMAQWSVKTQVNDLIGGVGFYNDGVKTRFAIHADQFYVFAPGINAFSLIIEGTRIVLPGDLISLGSITANKMNITNLSAITAVLGTMTSGTINSGLFRTESVVSNTRVEIDSSGSFPFWIGTGAKDSSNGQIYYDKTSRTFTIRDTNNGRRFEFQPGSSMPFWFGIGTKSAINGNFYFDSALNRLVLRNIQAENGYVRELQHVNYSPNSTGFKIFDNGSAEFNNVVISRPNVIASGTYNVQAVAQGSSHFYRVTNGLGIPYYRARTSVDILGLSDYYSYTQEHIIFPIDIPTSSFNPDEVGVVNGRMLAAQAVADQSIVYFTGSSVGSYSTACSVEICRALNYGQTGSFIRLLVKVHIPLGIPSNVTGISITRIRWALSTFT